MGSEKYVIGCDYGTLSMRAVLVRVSDGTVVAEEIYEYQNAVITDILPDGKTKLEGVNWALQDPDDYLRALDHCIPASVKKAGLAPEDVVGIGVDFTTCTMMPMTQDGVVLCQLPQYRSHPHAWVKLWKNHTAHREADAITEYVTANGLHTLDNYGFKASSEWFFPKLWETLKKDEEVYKAAYTFIEAGDYVVYKLCGQIVRSGVLAAAKGFHDNKAMSFPDKAFFKGLDPRLENVVEEKHLTNVHRVGEKAGELTAEMAARLGLRAGTAICVAHADAAVALPGGGVVQPNVMTLVLGTSTCHMMMAKEMEKIPGLNAVYYEGILPGLYCYEGGQGAVGDIFAWFCRNYLPASYTDEAKARGIHIMQLMNEKAGALKAGESGLVALDWHNGNRCILQDANLTGLIMGLNLLTKPEEIYRALIEATAFGTLVIMEQFARYNVPVKELYACGGLAHKNSLLMQIYADVLGRPIKVTGLAQTSAVSTAIFAAVAAGAHPGFEQAVAAMAPPPKCEYKPDPQNVKKYAEIYAVYKELHDYFGVQAGGPMRRLREIQLDSI